MLENEGISCVTAWCAAENTGSRKVLEKAGMQLINIEKAGLVIDDRVYDKMIYEYRIKKREAQIVIWRSACYRKDSDNFPFVVPEP